MALCSVSSSAQQQVLTQEPKQEDGYRHHTSVYWFRNALRFHDNPSLLAACQESKFLVPLYVIDPQAPFAQTSGRKAGVIRANFVLESLREMDKKLRTMGSRLFVCLGDPETVVPSVVSACQADALFYECEVAAPNRRVDTAVVEAVKSKEIAMKGKSKKGKAESKSCQIRSFDTHTLFPMELYLSKCKGNMAPATYGGFTKIFQGLTVPAEQPDCEQLPPLPETDFAALLEEQFGDASIPKLADVGYTNVAEALANRNKGGIEFRGGEDAALEHLEHMMSRTRWVATFEKPKTSPNALSVDTTGLSPYVKHGCLSPRRFFHELSAVYAKFRKSDLSKPPVSLHGQLMWREYNYLMGYTTPNFDYMVGNPVARQIPWDDDPALLDAWRNSKTGYPFIDAVMTQLRETGWIHHLARHAVACFLTRGDLWQSWERGAEVFEELLVDADWSINNFNWQWLSCTAHFYQYFRCYSPVAFPKKTDPNGNYIRKWLPMFQNMPKEYIYTPWEALLAVQKKCGVIIGRDYPTPIVDHGVISKSNMGRMKEAYDQQPEQISSKSDTGATPKRKRQKKR